MDVKGKYISIQYVPQIRALGKIAGNNFISYVVGVFVQGLLISQTPEG